MNQEPLIIGIDPGTTLGYAVIDTNGKLIKTYSSKNSGLSSLISGTIWLGKIIAVGTDKKNVPSLVKDFSAKTGARIISPREDLKIDEKRRLTSKFKTKDYHQMDALASALFVHKELSPLLRKIGDYAKNNNKEDIKNSIIEMVVAGELAIKDAVGLIEKPENVENKIIKKAIDKKKHDENDFLKICSKLKKYEKENYLLKKQRDNLILEMRDTKEKYFYVLRKINKFKIDEALKNLIKFKEKKINFFDMEIKNKDYKINQLSNEIKKLYYFLSNLDNNYLIKKLDNLGCDEFERKNAVLNIQKNDALMVDDPNIANERVVEQLKDKVSIIVHKKEINNKTKELPFLFINSRRLRVNDEKYFALVNKKDLEREKSQKNIISNIIRDYKQERAILADKNN